MPEMARITPMVPVTDIKKSINFFETVLGFETTYQQDNYAFMRRDNIAIRLLEAGKGVDLSDPRRQIACYIDVYGLDDLYAELKPKLDKLPKGRVRAPFNQDYGQREFHVIDEDALLIFFGEPIS
ncbi:MAG: VOC family protein [Pseudomonadota bacterium]